MRFRYQYGPAEDERPARVIIDLDGVDRTDHIVKQIRTKKRFYEQDLLDYLRLQAPCGGIYLDVGANIGNHAVFFGKFLADGVICIEPSPRIHPWLERNLRINRIKEFAIVPMAVGRTEGEGQLVLPEHLSANIGASRVVLGEPPGDAPAGDPITISTVDRVIEDAAEFMNGRPLSLIKIDVEEFELDVLAGARETIARYLPHIVIELGTDESLAAGASFLAQWGYEWIGRFCYTPTYHFIVPGHHILRGAPCIKRGMGVDARESLPGMPAAPGASVGG